MNKKHLITAILLVVTIVMGGAGIYIGLNMPKEVEELPQTGVSGVNCSCDRYNTFCGGETCNFSGYSDTTCPPNYTMSCASLNNASCREPKDSCECSCDGWPAPKPGYYIIQCGDYKGKSNQYQEYYTKNCAACNNPYFCVQCYEKKSVTTPPVTTTKPPVTTTKPPVTTTKPPITTTQPPVTTTKPPTNLPSTVIPETALISDEVDRMLIGFGLLMIGVMFFMFNYHIKLGNLFWNIKEVKPANYIDDKTKKVFKTDRENFERKF